MLGGGVLLLLSSHVWVFCFEFVLLTAAAVAAELFFAVPRWFVICEKISQAFAFSCCTAQYHMARCIMVQRRSSRWALAVESLFVAPSKAQWLTTQLTVPCFTGEYTYRSLWVDIIHYVRVLDIVLILGDQGLRNVEIYNNLMCHMSVALFIPL